MNSGRTRAFAGGWLAAWLLATVMLLADVSAHAAASPAGPVVFTDDRGTEHRLDKPPSRIVSMLPSLTEATWVLGGGSRLVGVDRYSDWPAEVERLPRLGGLDDALIESIAALKPDVILASTSSRAMERLDALGFRVVRLRSESHDDVRRTLDRLARLLGVPDEAGRVWSALQRRIDAASARVPPAIRGQRVYFEIGGGPYAAGTTSFIGETLARLGMANIVDASLGPFPKLNPEFVVRARPDLIMGVEREQAALLRRPGWESLAAVRDRRLCALPTPRYEMVIRPGPRLGEAADLIADCLVHLAEAGTR